jgi:hypothetical protein
VGSQLIKQKAILNSQCFYVFILFLFKVSFDKILKQHLLIKVENNANSEIKTTCSIVELVAEIIVTDAKGCVTKEIRRQM